MERQRIGLLAVVFLSLVGSCFAQPPYDRDGAARGGSAGTGNESPGGNDSGGTPTVEGNQVCVSPVMASEHLRARANVVSDEAVPPEREVFVGDLFEQFKAECGACHYEAAQGDFRVTRDSFFQAVNQETLDRIKSDDPTKFMPPPNSGGIPWSKRTADSVTELASRIEDWMAAGSPADVYFVKNESTDKPYLFSEELGQGMTNLGSCVPDTEFAVGSAQDEMDELDAMFAAAQAETSSLDEIVPPEDQLGLPRYLEDTDLNTFDSAALARSGVIAFVPTYPLWTDGAGKLRHVRVPRGTSIRFNKETQEFEIPANTRFYKTFFKDVIDRDGNERWRKMETRIIVARPDKVVDGVKVPQALFGTYQWDEEESRAELVTISQRNGEPFKDLMVTYTPDEPKAQAIRDSMPANLTYELEYAGALRRYAIPGKERCIQCHMGSPNNSFVLGFSPVQIRRRKTDEGGTYEVTGDDELSQLTRLISYGLITGIDDENDIKLLEDSQGERKPRNDYELKAQGYILGNCAHCHNVNGFPSQAAPELKDVLRFWPNAEGGVFQFPLERYSPRISRGSESQQIAYITPSLRDVWPLKWVEQPWTPKSTFDDVLSVASYFDAPWRSLIYRNVQTPFTYADDFTLYPHMPMNTASFDCRAQRILGDWMVSIPAVRKHPELHEDFYPINGLDPIFTGPTSEVARTDREPQPYVEVGPGSPGYEKALAAAEQRLAAFRASTQYKTCIEPVDIIDAEVYRGTGRSEPLDTTMPPDGVPDLPHWVSTDLTERAGPWSPRRVDWEEQLSTLEPSSNVVALLRQPTTKLTQGAFETFAKTPWPMSPWQQKDGCNLSQQPTAASFNERPRWFDKAMLPPETPIYSAWPGQAVFDMICTNCHGRNADSRGRQAETVQLMSGGETRVANLRDGFFGPPSSPGKSIADTFGKLATGDLTARDWGARYMSWMALGGTQRKIPPTVLGQVAVSDVNGTDRPQPLISRSDVDANMLASARVACMEALPNTNAVARVNAAGAFKFMPGLTTASLIETNGDRELWQRLCSINNEPVVRVIVNKDDSPEYSRLLYFGRAYPPGAPVGDHRGRTVNGLDPETNFFPTCIDRSQPKAEVYRQENPGAPPFCPEGFLVFANVLKNENQREDMGDDAKDWATRGAINAGFAVFRFLEGVSKGEINPVRYDECQLLK